jgi:hypothetical protein
MPGTVAPTAFPVCRFETALAGLARLLALAAASASVAACVGQAPRPGTEVAASRVALPGTVTKLDFFTTLNPDCTFNDYPTFRTVAAPSHGTLTMDRTSDFTSYRKDNQRFECNKQKSPGTLLDYKSNSGYVGADTVKVEVIFPSGQMTTVTYQIKVGSTGDQQGLKEIVMARAAVSGAAQRLDFEYDLNPDCSSRGDTKIRIVTQPLHGSLKVEDGTDYPNFTRDNSRYECNAKKAPGALVYYQSEAGYTGSDSADVEVSYPDGIVRKIAYRITVK